MSKNWRKSPPIIKEEAVAYHRVSTQKQGRSGLGLGAQQETVTAYAARTSLTLVNEYIEVETGTGKKHRPQLEAAIKEAKRRGAVLLVARLDRLARNVRFVTTLMESGVRFVCCDMPEANQLTIHVLAAVAEYEAKRTSQNTKEALAYAKSKGVKLGTPGNLSPEARALGHQTVAQEARDAYRMLEGYIVHLRNTGHTLASISEQLNREGYKTRRGKDFTPTHISRIIGRRSVPLPVGATASA